MSDLKFRSSFWNSIWIYSIYCLGYGILIPPFVLWIDSFGNLQYSVTYVSSIFILMLFTFAICSSVYAVYTCKIVVKETGIYGYNILNNYSFVGWSEID